MRFPVARLAAAGLFAAGVVATAAAQAPSAAKPAVNPPASPATSPSTTAAATAAPTVAGVDALKPMLSVLEIGNPLPQLPDCADHRTADGRDVTALCVELQGDGTMRQVGVPRDKRPAFMDGARLVAFVDGNALVGLIVPTDGIRSQEAALQSLNTRYGKPFRQEQEDLRDKAGKPVKAIHAGWMKRPLTIELYAIPDDPSEGTIELLLPQARALMANRDAEVAKSLAPASAPAARSGVRRERRPERRQAPNRRTSPPTSLRTRASTRRARSSRSIPASGNPCAPDRRPAACRPLARRAAPVDLARQHDRRGRMVHAIEHADLIEQLVEPRVRIAADHRHVVDRSADRVEFLHLR